MSLCTWVRLRIYFLGLQSIDEPKEEEVNSCVSNMQK